MGRVVAVRVHAPQPVLARLEDEREGGERIRRAQPHELVAARVDPRPEVLRVMRPQGAVDAVGGDDQVRIGPRRQIRHLAPEAEAYAQVGAPSLEEVEQSLAGHPGEAVAGGGQYLAPIVDVDVVPVGEAPDDGVVGLGIGVGEAVERGVREHHAEAEGVVGAVALEDRHVVAGIGLLHQEGQVQPRRSAADAD